MTYPDPPAPMNRWWRIGGAMAMNLALGSLYAWSVFVEPLEKRFGWSRSELSLAFTIAVAGFALGFLLAGPLQDRFGPLPISIIGGVSVSVGFFMCGGVETLRGLYGWFGVVVGLGTGFGYATPIPVTAKWFPDRRGLAVGLAVTGFGAGAAIFGPLCGSVLIPRFGLPGTFRILSVVFLAMTAVGAFLLRNPTPGWRPPGWKPIDSVESDAARGLTPSEVLQTSSFYLMWFAYALGGAAGLMVISQLVPFAKNRGISAEMANVALLVGAAGNAAGRTLSGWISDAIGRLNVLRLTIGVSVAAMPALYAAGGYAGGLFAGVFVVYWCFGTLLSVNASAAADFWGTKHAGINYGMLFTAYGVAGVIGPRMGAKIFDDTQGYQAAFQIAAALAAVALVCELLARRPKRPLV